MATFRVQPIHDRTSDRQRWEVKKDHDRVSTHNSRNAAKEYARDHGSKGDVLEVYDVDEEMDERYEIRKPTEGSADADDGDAWNKWGAPGPTESSFGG